MRLIMRRLLVAGAVALLLAACGGTGAPTPAATSEPKPVASTPTAAPAASPTAATTPTIAAAAKSAATPSAPLPVPVKPAATSTGMAATPGAPALGGTRSVEQVQGLNAFRYTMAMKIQGKNAAGQDVATSFDLAGEETRNPSAAHWTMTFSGAPTGQALGQGSLELYQVQGETYMRQGNIWIKSPVPATSLLASRGLFRPEDLATQLAGGRVVGTETISGRAATHYRLDKATLLASSKLEEADRKQFADLDSATLDVWVDNQHQFLSKFQMVTVGKQEIGEPLTGTMTIAYEVSDVNGDFTITLPDAARQAR